MNHYSTYFVALFSVFASACATSGEFITNSDGWYNVKRENKGTGFYYCSHSEPDKHPVCEKPQFIEAQSSPKK